MTIWYNAVFRQLSDPLPIAELEKIHEIVRQDRPVTNIEQSRTAKKTLDHKDSSDFVTTKKANDFVSKFYQKKMDINRGL